MKRINERTEDGILKYTEIISDYEKHAIYVIDRILKKIESDGVHHDLKFVIYPFGTLGSIVKNILNIHYGIKEYMICDNFRCNECERIKNLSEIPSDEMDDVIVLVSSDVRTIHEDILKAAYEAVPKERCVDVFPLTEDKSYRQRHTYMEGWDSITYEMGKIACRETAEYLMTKIESNIINFESRKSETEYLLYNEVDTSLGFIAEFGVYKAEMLNFMSVFCPLTKVYGFDCFEGLPEKWTCGPRMNADVGKFSLSGELPFVNSNVELVKGYFDETIPGFLEEHKENAAFIRIDSDLYSSAKTIFELMGDRIVKGTIIEFDEIFNYPGWKQQEFKAFNEFVDKNGILYEYIGYDDRGTEAAVRIIGRKE